MRQDMEKQRETVERAIRELGISSREERGMMRLAFELEAQQAEEREAVVRMLKGAGSALLLTLLIFLFVFLTFVFAPKARGDELPAAPIAKREVSKARVALTLANGALAFADVGYTRAHWGPGAREYDPLAKPIIEHGGVCYALAGAETVGLAWLEGRMRGSRRWHRVWWMPQAVGIAGHAYALSRTMERGR